jgi:hypothetical protein
MAEDPVLATLRSEGDIPIPVPFLAGDLVLVASAHAGKAPPLCDPARCLGNISLAEGSRISSGVAWREERNGSYLQTPVVYRGIIYASTNAGVVKAYDARSGQEAVRAAPGRRQDGASHPRRWQPTARCTLPARRVRSSWYVMARGSSC